MFLQLSNNRGYNLPLHTSHQISSFYLRATAGPGLGLSLSVTSPPAKSYVPSLERNSLVAQTRPDISKNLLIRNIDPWLDKMQSRSDAVSKGEQAVQTRQGQAKLPTENKTLQVTMKNKIIQHRILILNPGYMIAHYENIKTVAEGE